MAKKRKASTSQLSHEQKPKLVREIVEEEEEISEEEEQEEEESSEGEETESGSESEGDDEEEKEEEEDEESSSEDEENDEASKRETLRELLEPFGKSQIIDVLKESASKDPKIISKIAQVADADPTHRKNFVHGLGWDATSDQLLQAFKSFGEIEDSKLVTDKNTGRAKGYAFVVFKTRAAAKKALKVPQKRIGSRTVSCQLAALGPPTGAGAADGGSRKIYVGNVGPHVSVEKLKAFFERFGEIEEGPSGMDPATNKFKGFAVITFKSAEGFKKVLEEPIKVFENCQFHCKKFVEKNNQTNAGSKTGAGSASPAVTDASYGGVGVSAGVMGANLNASGLLMASNPGIGYAGNPMLAAGYNPAGLVASGLSTPVAGMGGGYAGMYGNYALNSISPGMMENYSSQAALQGFGGYQNAQVGQSAVGTAATTTTASRTPASGGSASTTYSSYYNL